MNILRIIDEIEGLVENSTGGFMGKRWVNEEEFFTKILELRSALPAALRDAEIGVGNAAPPPGSPPLDVVLANARGLARGERLELVARLSADLMRESS